MVFILIYYSLCSSIKNFKILYLFNTFKESTIKKKSISFIMSQSKISFLTVNKISKFSVTIEFSC